MCLLCEEDAFFRAYWEQVRKAAPGEGHEPSAAITEPARFTASAVEGEARTAPGDAAAAGTGSAAQD